MIYLRRRIVRPEPFTLDPTLKKGSVWNHLDVKLGLRQNPVHRVVKNGVRFAAVLLVAVLRADVGNLEFELVRRTGRITGRVVGNVEPRINAKLLMEAV